METDDPLCPCGALAEVHPCPVCDRSLCLACGARDGPCEECERKREDAMVERWEDELGWC